MKHWKRRLAAMLCIIILVLPLISMLFISTHIQHDCTGKDCVVCSEIKLAVQVINHTKLTLCVAGAFAAAICSWQSESLLDTNISLIHKTLISLKVELLE